MPREVSALGPVDGRGPVLPPVHGAEHAPEPHGPAVLIVYEREFILSVVAYALSLVMTALANAGFFLAMGMLKG